MSLDSQYPRIEIEIGKVTKPHGVHGEVKVHIYSGNLSFFVDFPEFFLLNKKTLIVESSRVANDVLLVVFEGVDSIEKAKAICGEGLFVLRSSLNLKEGEFLVDDYKGLKVFEVNQKKVVGVINAYFDVNDGLFEVVLPNGKKALIPHNGEYFGKPDFKLSQVPLNDHRGFLDYAV